MPDGPEDQDDNQNPDSPGGSRFPDPPSWKYKRKERHKPRSGNGNYSGLATGVKYAYLIIAPMIAGWLVGYLIDRNSGDGTAQMWGTIIGFFAGMFIMVLFTSRSQS